jgi:hypothetical protein
MKIILPIVLVCIIAGGLGCNVNRRPEHLPVEMAFFKCEKCRSLEGGIFGKGTEKLYSPKSEKCVHDWQRISKKEFKKLGTQWRGVDWKREGIGFFWQNDEPDKQEFFWNTDIQEYFEPADSNDPNG